jgi:histidinol-phosphate/aromatic aminotransferase/cobyric acid decarboxylase-like protein
MFTRILVVGVITLTLLLTYCDIQREFNKTTTWSDQEKTWVVKQMKKHGIDACVKDARGYYFIRNGKRVKL